MSIKTLKNGPQKLLIIGPDPFISQSSPDHSPQPRIDFSYYEISGPANLIYDDVNRQIKIKTQKPFILLDNDFISIYDDHQEGHKQV